MHRHESGTQWHRRDTGNTEVTWRKEWQWASRAQIPGLWQCWEVVSGNLRPCQSPSNSHANRQEVELAFPTSLNQLGSEEKARPVSGDSGQRKRRSWRLPNDSLTQAWKGLSLHVQTSGATPSFANPVELPYQSGGPCNTPGYLWLTQAAMAGNPQMSPRNRDIHKLQRTWTI